MNALGRAAMNNAFRAAVQERYVMPKMLAMGGDLAGCRVLEVGCGRGRGLHLIRDHMGATEVLGIDVDPTMVGKVDRAVPVAIADMASLPVRDSAIDAVVDFGALHLVLEWRAALREVHRVLRPGGRYLFEQIVGRVFRSSMTLATGQRLPREFDREALLRELALVGLEVESLQQPKLMLATGMAGDLIGLARRN